MHGARRHAPARAKVSTPGTTSCSARSMNARKWCWKPHPLYGCPGRNRRGCRHVGRGTPGRAISAGFKPSPYRHPLRERLDGRRRVARVAGLWHSRSARRLTPVHIQRDQIGEIICRSLIAGSDVIIERNIAIDPESMVRDSTGAAPSGRCSDTFSDGTEPRPVGAIAIRAIKPSSPSTS